MVGYKKEITEIYDELSHKDVSKNTEKKGKFTYLSWAWAVRELLNVDPEATWEVHEYLHGKGEVVAPYMRTGAGCFVKVTVWSGGIARHQVHPVLDHTNKSIEEPNAFQVNTSIQRCLAKAIALHGLGLYIYAGEDLPAPPKPLSKEQYQEITMLLAEMKDFDEESSKIIAKMDSEEINESNFKGSIAKLKRINNFKDSITKLERTDK